MWHVVLNARLILSLARPLDRDEAFELGMQWASLYEEGSASRDLIKDVMNTSYLVNIVANDFKDGLSIFEPFQLDRVMPVAAVSKAVNGVSHAVSSATESVTSAAGAVVNGVTSLVNGSGSATEHTNGHAEPKTKTNGTDVEGSVYDPDTAAANGADQVAPIPNGKTEPATPKPTQPEGKDSAVNRGHGAGPALKASKNLDELFDSVPLFMRENPVDGEENETLEALKSLMYDGTPDGK